jgi:fumarate reductase subunit C
MTRELTRPLPRTWWLTTAPYLRFMIRELTSVVVFAYTLLIIWALWSVADSNSFSVFLGFLTSPVSVGLHVVVLVLALYHTWTWIALTPKVMVLWKDDDRVEPDLIAGLTAVAFLAISGVVVWLVLL